MPLRRSLTVFVTVSVLALTAACGSRLSDEERALATTGLGGAGGVTDGGPVTDGEGVADPEATTDGGDTGGTGGSGGTTTGGTTTGGSTGGTGGTGGPAACKPGSATSTGVSPTEIKVGNVSQITGLVPGFGNTGVAGVKAYFNMINNQGGVCGRKLTLVTADDKFQAASNRNETEKLSGQVIAFVGNTSVVDEGGAPVIDEKKIADISLATTTKRVQAEMNFSPNPIDPNAESNGLHRILTYFKETQGVKSGAIFYQDAAVASQQVPRYREDFRLAGIPIPSGHEHKVAINATNFRTEATKMKQDKIDLVITIAEIGAIANLAKAFDDVDYFPKVPFYGAQTYGQKLIRLAGPAAEGTEIGLIFAVPEEKSTVPGMADFDTWYKRTAGSLDADFFAILSWVAASMFVEALRAAGPDPSQAKIVAHMKTVTKYTGGGIVAPINPAQKKTTTCFQVVEVKGGKWVKQHPAKGFAC